MEGSICFASTTCDMTGLTLPVTEYDHTQGCSISGGVVYRGTRYPALQGIYFFGMVQWANPGTPTGKRHLAKLRLV